MPSALLRSTPNPFKSLLGRSFAAPPSNLQITGLVLLFVFFTGCDNSNSFIAFSLLSIVTFTGIQLFATHPGDQAGGQGHNFLASAVRAAALVMVLVLG